MAEVIQYKLATLSDLPALQKVGDLLFDHPIIDERTIEFLKDPRHHLVLAYHKNKIVGMASGLHYVHPDKEPQMFINEVAVLDNFQNRGIGRQLVKELIELGRGLGCTEAWVGTEISNAASRKCYKAAGGKEDDEPFVLINFE